MFLDVFSTIINALGELTSTIGLSWLAVIGLGLAMLTIIISFIVTQFSIEMKTARAVIKINKYLELNPFVNDDNLVEFNKLMKHIPQPMRIQWQQYMVNRNKKPSEFFTDENCIEKPFKSSAYASQIVAVKASLICLAVLMFVFNMSYYVYIAESSLLFGVLSSLLVSTVIIFVGVLYLLFLKSRRNSCLSDLYLNFANFQKYIDRACGTLPEYVDYEILFTRKEITSGIPVLQEYLQQRALYEQEQIQKAKESQVVHEEYDFSALGINGSLVMERAMRECEYFIGNKRRILSEISELEGSRDMLDKSYDEKNKNSQRKLRDIQESLDRLKEKLDSTTNLIVGNDLRKQRENEIQKQRQLEKEAEEDNRKYDADKKALNDQIEAKRAEIEEFRKNAEEALNGEFRVYADKIYKELKDVADAQVKEQVDTLNAEKVELQQNLEEAEKLFAEKSTVCDEKSALVEEYSARLAEQEVMIAEAQKIKDEFEQYSTGKDDEIFETKKQLESKKIELEKKELVIQNQKEEIKELKKKKQVIVNRYFDMNGNEIFYDDAGNAYMLDKMGEKEYLETAHFEQNEADINEDEMPVEQEEMPEEQEPVEEEPVNEEPVETELDAEEFNFGFSDADIASALGEDPEEQKQEEPQPDLEALKKQFHKPVYDFQWENSNAQKQQEPEEDEGQAYTEQPNESDKLEEQPDETIKSEENAEEQPQEIKEDAIENLDDEVVENAADEEHNEKVDEAQVESDDIEEIDKMIEEQNAELEKQNQNLSKQLEETQKAIEQDAKTKRPAKNKKKSNAKKKAKNKKSENKKKQPKNKGKKENVDFGAVDINLEDFNKQINKAIKDIDNSNNGK